MEPAGGPVTQHLCVGELVGAPGFVEVLVEFDVEETYESFE